MRLHSRSGGGRVRRLAFMILLATVAALVMLIGLVVVVALLFAAAVVASAVYIWNRLRRMGARLRNRPGRHGGVTIEGEYTVENPDADLHDPKR
ncbi:MAG TPA: hypothetical protein VJS89_09765 [Gammaproteobacteria bacterium]|nr:hypothetical protein [Gammaproteobacteria bacterium]